MSASSCRQLCAARKTVGMVEASAKVTVGGMGTSVCPQVRTAEPRQPAACPKTASPTLQRAPVVDEHIAHENRLGGSDDINAHDCCTQTAHCLPNNKIADTRAQLCLCSHAMKDLR